MPPIKTRLQTTFSTFREVLYGQAGPGKAIREAGNIFEDVFRCRAKQDA
jgi:hypothetical protein